MSHHHHHHSLDNSSTASSRAIVPSSSNAPNDDIHLSTQPATVTKTSSARSSATSTTVRSSLVAATSSVTFGASSDQVDRPSNTIVGYNSLQSSHPVLVEIEDAVSSSSNGSKGAPENCTSSSSPQSTANSVILPTLIEAPGATPTQLLIPVPDTRAGTDQQPLSQQLSFPNVSILGQSAVPVSSSSNDDPLRTPPRPFIEDHTSKTGNNSTSIVTCSVTCVSLRYSVEMGKLSFIRCLLC